MLGWLTEFEVLPLVIRGDCTVKGGLEHREEVSYEVKEHPESGKSQQAESLPQSQAQEGHLAWKLLSSPAEHELVGTPTRVLGPSSGMGRWSNSLGSRLSRH